MFGTELTFMFVLLGIMTLISFVVGLRNWVNDIKDR